MDTFKITLLRRLKEMRRAAGYTQNDLAIKLWVTRGTVTRWEKDGCGLDLDQIEKIAECLKIDSARLLEPLPNSDRNNEPLLHIASKLNDDGFQFLIQQAHYLTYVPEFCN